MLEEIIKELTATSNDDHITRGVYWPGQKELNTLTESRQFNKINISKRAKQNTARATVGQTSQWQPCWYCGGVHPLRQYAQHIGRHVWCVARWDISRKYAAAKEVGQ